MNTPVNPRELAPPAANYSHAFVSLRDDEALVVEIDPDDASLWDVMLYNRSWYEALDFANLWLMPEGRLRSSDAYGDIAKRPVA